METTPGMSELRQATHLLANSQDPNDHALMECIAAAVGAWRQGQAQQHADRIRDLLGGGLVPVRFLEPGVN